MEVPHAGDTTGELVDSSLEVVLTNAAQVKNVPGRKSDVNDATWVSELLTHGLVRASFVPPAIKRIDLLQMQSKQETMVTLLARQRVVLGTGPERQSRARPILPRMRGGSAW